MNTKKTEKKDVNLPWKYCECGCKGHSVSLGQLHYWMFNDIHGDHRFHLRKGHGMLLGEDLGDYDSFEAADRATQKHVKSFIKKRREKLKQIETAMH